MIWFLLCYSAIASLAIILFVWASCDFAERWEDLKSKNANLRVRLEQNEHEVTRLKKQNKISSDNHVLRVEEIKRLNDRLLVYKTLVDRVCDNLIKLDDELFEVEHAPQEETPH